MLYINTFLLLLLVLHTHQAHTHKHHYVNEDRDIMKSSYVNEVEDDDQKQSSSSNMLNKRTGSYQFKIMPHLYFASPKALQAKKRESNNTYVQEDNDLKNAKSVIKHSNEANHKTDELKQDKASTKNYFSEQEWPQVESEVLIDIIGKTSKKDEQPKQTAKEEEAEAQEIERLAELSNTMSSTQPILLNGHNKLQANKPSTEVGSTKSDSNRNETGTVNEDANVDEVADLNEEAETNGEYTNIKQESKLEEKSPTDLEQQEALTADNNNEGEDKILNGEQNMNEGVYIKNAAESHTTAERKQLIKNSSNVNLGGNQAQQNTEYYGDELILQNDKNSLNNKESTKENYTTFKISHKKNATFQSGLNYSNETNNNQTINNLPINVTTSTDKTENQTAEKEGTDGKDGVGSTSSKLQNTNNEENSKEFEEKQQVIAHEILDKAREREEELKENEQIEKEAQLTQMINLYTNTTDNTMANELDDEDRKEEELSATESKQDNEINFLNPEHVRETVSKLKKFKDNAINKKQIYQKLVKRLLNRKRKIRMNKWKKYFI